MSPSAISTGIATAKALAAASLCAVLVSGLGQTADAQRAVPVVHGDGYRIAAGPVEVVIAPSRGARVRSLKYSGTELLYQADSTGNPGSMGSTFWVSPQAHWTANCRSGNNNGCWPPPTAFDGSGAASLYTGGLIAADTAVSYTGSAHAYTGARLRKTVWGNTRDSSVTFRYHIVNTLATKIAFAPWEVTRMTTGGLTFWAKSNEDTIQGNGTSGAALIAMIKDTLGVKWHKYDSAVSLSGGTPKFWDGTSEGWFAHVDKSRLLYIKKFVDIPASKKAPDNENQIEYYTNNNTRSLIEMELQGAFDSIPAGDSLQWDVSWFVRRLPDNIAVTHSAELLAFTRATVAGPTSILGTASRRDVHRLAATSHRVTLMMATAGAETLDLIDARGALVQRLHAGTLPAGRHAFALAPSTPKGLYGLVLRGPGAKVLEARLLPRF
jgi:hypothetical protein